MPNYRAISACRLCGSGRLEAVLDLGDQYLTGVFPRAIDRSLTTGPLILGFCADCALAQLMHSYDPSEMYGENYGYRSSLNKSMVEHLRRKVDRLRRMVELAPQDLVLDIGSNDGTLLSFYPGDLTGVGFDPCIGKFQQYYSDDTIAVAEFFSAKSWRARFGNAKAKLVTSVAMLYDLEHPLEFMHDVASIMADDGVWHFEQSYLVSMLEVNAYDTICHEHLEYYGLQQIRWLTDRAGLRILDVERTPINGGSFAVTVCKETSSFLSGAGTVDRFIAAEDELGLGTVEPYARFRQRVFAQRDELLRTLEAIRREDGLILGYGASTKGNVILQFCGLGPSDLPMIAEVNADKFGCVTPGTWIPIVPEAEAREQEPAYFLVLPWHFERNIMERESSYLERGGKLLLPLPEVRAVGR